MNSFSFLLDAARRWGDVPAVISPDRTVTYQELLQLSETLRDDLIARGVTGGLGLGLTTRNSVEFVIGLFAGLAAGAVVMPISHNLKAQEVERMIDLVPVSALLHDGSLKHELRGSTTDLRGPFRLIERSNDFRRAIAAGVPNAAVVRFTSGTTGTAKGVVLSHDSIGERTEFAAKALDLCPGRKVIWVLPMAYHFVVSILTYVRSGVTMILPHDSMPGSILSAAQDHGAALLYASPLIAQMLAADATTLKFPEGSAVVATSSGLTRETSEAFFRRFGLRPAQMYGIIEVGLPIGNAADESIDPWEIGRALPGYEVAILGSDGSPMPDGQIGRLAVRGPGMFDAYLAPFRKREEILENGWFLTGDLASRDPGGVISVRGREKSVINTGGNKVFPEEVEAVLNSFPGVKSSRAYGVPHALTGEIVSADIVSNGPAVDAGALRAYCYERLSPYKVPKEIHLVASLPTTDSGKIIRAA